MTKKIGDPQLHLCITECVNNVRLMLPNKLDCHLLLSPVVGYSLVAVNGEVVSNKQLSSGRSAMEAINDPKNFPLRLRFKRLKASVNERIMLLSMFHS